MKLPHLDTWTEQRRVNADNYNRLFKDLGITEQIVRPLERAAAKHIYNQYVIRVPKKRDDLRSFLAEKGIGTDIYYPVPLHLQECFADLGYSEGDMPEAEKASRQTLALPIYPELRLEQQEYVVQTVAAFFNQ